MFKIGTVPSVEAGPVEHADFLEIECLKQSDLNISGGDLSSKLGRVADDLEQDRAKSDERMEGIIEDTFTELSARAGQCGDGPYIYPFTVNEASKLLEYTGPRLKGSLYLFQLFATRMNMRAEKVQAGTDGTALFEEICCEVAKSYWGDRADGLVFGTARRNGNDEVGAFPQAVNELCKRLGECVGFHPHSGYPPSAQDGNLDVVVWKHFSDGRFGKLIGFGQCKTGTHWKAGLFEMVPDGFCRKWVRTMPVVDPIRLYFITSRMRHTEWYDSAVDAGILFDRCRILDYSPRMANLKHRWQAWTKAAMTSKGMRPI